MGRCVRCGRKSLFLKVNWQGNCSQCEIELLEEEKKFKSAMHTRIHFETPSKNNNIGGDIGRLDLREFWGECTEEEKKVLIRYSRSALGASYNASPISGEPACNQTKLSFLHGYITWAVSENNFVLADKLIGWAERYYGGERNYVTRHFYLSTVAECYYKQREARKDAFDLVEKYCLRDIDIYDKYMPVLRKGCEALPSVKSFKRLAIMYEKNGRYSEAIRICQMALDRGQVDGTKAGYRGRLEKLQKKIEQNERRKPT